MLWRKKIITGVVLSVALFFCGTFHAHAARVFCKIIDHDGNPIPGVLMWYKAGGDMIRIRNTLARGEAISVDRLWGIGRGYGIQTGERVNYSGNFDPREDAAGRHVRDWPVRVTIVLTKEGYRSWSISDTVPYNEYIVGRRVFTVFLKRTDGTQRRTQRHGIQRRNMPPEIENMRITQASVNCDFICEATVIDNNNDPIKVLYEFWEVDDKRLYRNQRGEAILENNKYVAKIQGYRVLLGVEITCKMTPFDGKDYGIPKEVTDVVNRGRCHTYGTDPRFSKPEQ